MKLIEKIEIKNFRSFLGTIKGEEAEIINISDLNIFSGANDSGKSNILRALNLFFNDKVSVYEGFNFNRDFPYSKLNDYRKVVSIKIYFDLSSFKDRDKFLPERFSITKSYNQFSDNYRDYLLEGTNKKGEEIKIFSDPDKNANKKSEKQYRQHLFGFLNNVTFEYVPAIKDQQFFSHIFGRIISLIKNKEDLEINEIKAQINDFEEFENTISKIQKLIKVRENKINKQEKFNKHKVWKKEIEEFKKKIENLNDDNFRDKNIKRLEKELEKVSILDKSIKQLKEGINSYSNEFLNEVSSFLPSEFIVSQDFESFFQKFDLGTGDNRTISLRLRGDGIQAKFIPEFLNFLNTYDNKKFNIWGFEEPENSSEYRNQQELAEKLKTRFIGTKQIFLTTHSEEFLSLYDDSSVQVKKRAANLYHVKKKQTLISDKKNKKKHIVDFSVIEFFDVDKNVFVFGNTKSELEQDLGTSIVRAKYSKELKKIEEEFLEERTKDEHVMRDKLREIEELSTKLNSLNPEKVFICEDEKGVKIWEHFFTEFGIIISEIIPSGGCTKFDWEDYFLKIDKKSYNPNLKIFRQNDRDGLDDKRIQFVENEIGKKYKNINYKFLHLPVNEIENFYIITDKFFSDSILEKNKNDLELTFAGTIQCNFDKYNKEYGDDFFKKQDSFKILTECKQDSGKDVKKYYPGKDIKKLKENLNIEREFLKWKLKDFPQELRDYLQQIKDFFEDTNK